MHYIPNIEALSLITSCGCNLNCAYCQIDQARNKNSAHIQHQTIKALDDGTFLENTKKVLEKVGASPNNITNISLWGQEPTLTLHLFTKHLKDWLELFPNLSHMMFSTNTMDHADRIIDFVKTMDELITHSIRINIQFSYDGDESTDTIRLADTSRIYKNMEKVILGLNSLNLKHVRFHGNIHGVVSLDMMNRLNNDSEKLYAYYKNLHEWADHFYHLNTNKKVDFEPTVDLSMEIPIPAVTTDGMKLAQFVELSRRLDLDSLSILPGLNPLATLCGQYVRITNKVLNNHITNRENIHTAKELMAKITSDSRFKKDIFDLYNKYLFCGNGYGELKIMYDGTLVNCQNQIFDTELEYLPTDNSMRSIVKRELVKHKFFINPLKDSDEQIKKYFEYFRVSKEDCFNFMYMSTINTMFWLAQIGQIDASYKDMNKVLFHALLITIFNSCSYNHQITTGSIFLKHSGYIKMMCNGFLDQALAGGNM